MKESKPYAKLRGRLAERGLTQNEIATMLGVSLTSVNNKLTGKTEFSPKEMKILKMTLDLETIDAYFFAD
ncbi:MAG: helix-turn-helix transcriptional regulator [Achromobacter sp.]|nr:helix-turn-helix transcriptional regulator [Achromobacter sp.]MBQ3612726.1 helix-turn-helix transcriptional regulator [Bacteroidales bacterium]